jgi:hypothetical protein
MGLVNALALRAHHVANVRGLRPTSRSTVSAQTPVVFARIADLTPAEREHVLRALTKIHRAASDALAAQDVEPRPAAAPGAKARTPRSRTRRAQK